MDHELAKGRLCRRVDLLLKSKTRGISEQESCIKGERREKKPVASENNENERILNINFVDESWVARSYLYNHCCCYIGEIRKKSGHYGARSDI
jgi:hypothetical protein